MPHTTAETTRVRIAHCIVGLAASGKRDADDWRRGWGITDARNYEATRQWVEVLSRPHDEEVATVDGYGIVRSSIKSDIFLRIDLRNETIHPRRVAGIPSPRFATPGYEPLSDPACWSNGTAQPVSSLDAAISALRPVSVATAPEPCYCATHAEQCACGALRDPAPSLGSSSTAGNPSFMEQMQRIWACYGDVRRHEKRHGVRYDFITKIRSDFDWAANHVTPTVFALAVRDLVAGPPRIVTANWGQWYNNVDWLWIAPRKLAAIAFSFSEAPCAWLDCVNAKFLQKGMGTGTPNVPWFLEKVRKNRTTPLGLQRLPSYRTDGELLGEWWLSHGVPFEALRGTHGNNQNDAEVRLSQKAGLVTAAKWIKPLCPPTRFSRSDSDQ